MTGPPIWRRYQVHVRRQDSRLWLRDLSCTLPFLTILYLSGWRWVPLLELATGSAVLARLAIFALTDLLPDPGMPYGQS